MLLLSLILRRFVRDGHLIVVDHANRRHDFGVAGAPPVTIRLGDRATARRLALNPDLALGQAYMDGTLTVENGDVADLLDLVARNLGNGQTHPYGAWPGAVRGRLMRLMTGNTPSRARRNAHHHYDLSGRLYDLFLDSDKQYSCAFFERPDDNLETAQANKCRRIAAKLALKPGQRVLDIGSGWGGLSLHLARTAPVDVTGITLSQEQLKIAQDRAARSGMADRVRFGLQDYRDVRGPFERIVSVGMFEHVGVAHYRAFFGRVARLLTDDGVALIHSIGRSDGPGATNPWIAKYIFPGGYTPALSEVLPAVERAGLMVTDIEILRLHYAQTLALWRQRFAANRDRARALYDERFCRMWEFYLAAAEMGFRHQGLMVFQLQLAKRVETLPIVRDYMIPVTRTIPESRKSAA